MLSTTNYNTKIDDRLELLFPSSNFVNKMKELNFVIGGSFIINTILEEKWRVGDIDIYCNYNPDENIYNHPLNIWIINELGGFMDRCYNYFGHLSCDFILKNITINVIYIQNNLQIQKYIEETSDLTICTSLYNGFFTSYHSDLLNRIATKINSHLKPENNPEDEYNFIFKRMIRCIKYKLRGFEIENFTYTNENLAQHNSYFIQLEKRRNKIRDKILKYIQQKDKFLHLTQNELPFPLNNTNILEKWI